MLHIIVPFLLVLAIVFSVTLLFLFINADADFTLLLKRKVKREEFEDKVVWITGASRGIGEFLAKQLCGVGAKLIISARNVAELERVKTELTGKHAQDVKILPVDLGSGEANLREAVERAESFFPGFGVDFMVHNAAFERPKSPALDASEESLKATFDINVLGTISLTKLLAPYMLRRGKGHFVVMSSAAGKTPAPGQAIYSASKFALNGYFHTLRSELCQKGIKVTVVCPGPIDTSKGDATAACDDRGLGDGQEKGNADEAVVANRETGKGKSKVEEKHLGPRGRRFKSVARRIRGVTIANAVETSESMGKDDHIPSSPDDNSMQEPPPPKHSSREPQKILVDRPSTRTMTEEISAMVRSDCEMNGVAAKVNHITQELHAPISYVDGAAAEAQQKEILPCWVEGQDGDNHNHPAARNAQDHSRGSDASEWDGLAEKFTRSASHCSSLSGPKNSPKTGNLFPLGGVLSTQGKSTGRRQRKAWSPLEEDTLRKGVKEFGIGSWSRIYKTYLEIFKHRTDVDLKDKWRNLSR